MVKLQKILLTNTKQKLKKPNHELLSYYQTHRCCILLVIYIIEH